MFLISYFRINIIFVKFYYPPSNAINLITEMNFQYKLMMAFYDHQIQGNLMSTTVVHHQYLCSFSPASKYNYILEVVTFQRTITVVGSISIPLGSSS